MPRPVVETRRGGHRLGTYLETHLGFTTTKFNHAWEYGNPLPTDGTTFTASPQTVAAVNTCLANAGCELNFVTGSLGRGGDDWFTPAELGLNGQQLTRITRTISDARLTWEGGYYGHYLGNIKQVVSFYGEEIPEPTTLTLVGFALVVGLLCHRK